MLFATLTESHLYWCLRIHLNLGKQAFRALLAVALYSYGFKSLHQLNLTLADKSLWLLSWLVCKNVLSGTG